MEGQTDKTDTIKDFYVDQGKPKGITRNSAKKQYPKNGGEVGGIDQS